MNRIMGVSLIFFGSVLVVAALALMLVIVPSLKVFPDDVDEIRIFNLSYLTLLNADTFEFFVAEPGENPDLRISRHIVVEETAGNQMLVSEDQRVLNGDELLIDVFYHYALDRKTLESLAEYPDEWAARDGLWARTGLVMGWGIGVERRNYTGWNEDFRHTVELVFTGEEEHAGINTYHFTAVHTEPQPIDPAHVEFLGLPNEISIDTLAQLAANLEIEDPALRTQVQTLLPIVVRQAVMETQNVAEGEEPMVPLVYQYDYVGEYWVEPTTGVLINTRKYEHRTVNFAPEVLSFIAQTLAGLGRDPEALNQLLPLTINEFEYEMSPQSIEDAKSAAQEAIDRINLFGRTVPFGMIAAGIVLAGLGVYTLTRKTQAGSDAATATG